MAYIKRAKIVIVYSELESIGPKVTMACFQELLKILPEKNRKLMEGDSMPWPIYEPYAFKIQISHVITQVILLSTNTFHAHKSITM
jgi:hypothetical protein